MSCIRPLRGFRAPGGQVKFSRKGAWSDRPVTVSCGRCISCRLARSRDWALRCVHEAQLHERNCFVTLTYDNEHLPKDLSVDVEHWQKFAKRLRKRCGRFRFLHCGEYGERTFRPHYHACIFGLDFSRDSMLWKREKDYTLSTSPMLNEIWGMGHCILGALNYGSAAYVARYVMKKMTGDLAKEEYRRLDERTGEEWFVKPPYVTMSRRPGLGAEWFSRFYRDVYPDDVCIRDGRKQRPPKFYDRLMERKDPVFWKGVAGARRRAEDQEPDRLYAREIILGQNHGGSVRDM